MQQRSIIRPSFPRLVGSLLVSVSVAAQGAPAFAQTGAAKPANAANAGSAPSNVSPATATPAPASAAPPSATPAAPTAATAGTAPNAAVDATTSPTGETPSAPAADPAAEARAAEAAQASEQGQAAYRAGDYTSAEQWFDRALRAQPSALARYWRASSIDLQGRAADAVVAYTELFESPDVGQLPANLSEPARQRLELLNKIPATVLFNVTPSDAQVVIDGTLQSGASPYVLKLSAGKHTLRVTRDGYTPLETQIDVRGAQSTEQAVQLEPLAASTTQPGAADGSEASGPRSRIPAYVTLGVAGVAAGLGTVFGIQALSAKSDFDDSPTASTADDVERNALIADMAWGIAITLGITGTVLLLSDEPAEQAPKTAGNKLRVAPYVTAHGAGAAAAMKF